MLTPDPKINGDQMGEGAGCGGALLLEDTKRSVQGWHHCDAFNPPPNANNSNMLSYYFQHKTTLHLLV